MLRAVGHPVAVNPDGTLARVAREEGWEILRFERLNRRLRFAGALAGAAALGGAGSLIAQAGDGMQRAHPRAGGDPLAGAALRRREDRAARRRVGPESHVPLASCSPSSASSG